MLALVVLGRGGFVVGHFVFEHSVDKNGELASGRGNGFGLVSASGQPAIERPKRMVAAMEGHGRDSKDLGGPVCRGLRARTQKLPTRDLVARCQREPGSEVMLRGPAMHIKADFGDQLERAVGANTRKLGDVDPSTELEQGGADLERRRVVLGLSLGARPSWSGQIPR